MKLKTGERYLNLKKVVLFSALSISLFHITAFAETSSADLSNNGLNAQSATLTASHDESTNHNFTSLNLTLSPSELRWIGSRIYANECASKPENLIIWGQGEEFPSLGIGHFIWYPKDFKGPFVETFPDMVAYVSQYKTAPLWLKTLEPFSAPWSSKEAFLKAVDSKDMALLRQWLLATQTYQTQYISLELNKRFNDYLSTNNDLNKTAIILVFNQLMQTKEGRFALIDYVNFKGMGAENEQYQGEQWGLISVLKPLALMSFHLMDSQQLLQAFVDSAKQRLNLRVELSPKVRNEQRWLKGWFKRLDGYLK